MELALLSPQQVVAQGLAGINLEKIARESGWQRRRGKKLHVANWVKALMGCAWQSDGRLGQWAWQVGLVQGQPISVQGLHRRVNLQAVEMVKQLWGLLLAQEMEKRWPKLLPKLKGFSRVLVQDSTCVKLPACLQDRYPGSANRTGLPMSQARLDVIYELRSGRLLRLGLSGFRRNDQAGSGDVLGLCRKGDLLIRDLGYAVFGVWKQLMDEGVTLLSRIPHMDRLCLEKEGRILDLLRTVRGQSVVDMQVMVGLEHRLPMRLVAVRVPEQVAAMRRRKARQDRDGRVNHSKRYMELLGWNIFLTNLDVQSFSPQEVVQAYGLRWRIEVFFKACKQSLHLTRWHHRASACAVELSLQVRLLGLLWISRFYSLCQEQAGSVPLSLLKVFAWISLEWRTLWSPPVSMTSLTRLLLYHSRYHKRKKSNYIQQYQALC